MATHSSILAWRISRTEEPVWLQVTCNLQVIVHRCEESGHDWSNCACTHTQGHWGNVLLRSYQRPAHKTPQDQCSWSRNFLRCISLKAGRNHIWGVLPLVLATRNTEWNIVSHNFVVPKLKFCFWFLLSLHFNIFHGSCILFCIFYFTGYVFICYRQCIQRSWVGLDCIITLPHKSCTIWVVLPPPVILGFLVNIIRAYWFRGIRWRGRAWNAW